MSNAPSGTCSNRFKIELKVTWNSGNPVEIHAYTGQPELNVGTTSFNTTFSNAFSF